MKMREVTETDVETLEEIHSALDAGLGDTDVSHIESDDELRSEEPVQWAAMKLAILINTLSSNLALSAEARSHWQQAADLWMKRTQAAEAGLKSMADLLTVVIADEELRGKYVVALLRARDAARDLLKVTK